MSTAIPPHPPKAPKDDVNWVIIGAVIYAVIATIAIILKPLLALILVPLASVLVVVSLSIGAQRVARWKLETDHLRRYQHIADVDAEGERRRQEIQKHRGAEQAVLDSLKLSVGKLRTEAEALSRRVEGYGDAYVIATHTLIDDLAADYGHTEAGKQLAQIRETVRSMNKNTVKGHTNKPLARLFLAAFNGDVDEVLRKAKHDNFGKLKKELEDSFSLLNKNGSALGIVLTEMYLKTRIEELKWTVIIQELRKREADEQREIREQMREEERAAREFAKAQAQAEREAREAAQREQELRVAIEQARAEAAAAASAEERAKQEERIAILSTSLSEAEERAKEAEARGQRALSMAQQTKAGTVYVISNIGSFGEDVFKIGMTRRLHPQDRVDELGDASVPFEFDVHAFIETSDAPGLENRLHKQFASRRVNKVNPRKEFFHLKVDEIRNALSDELQEVKFTLLAEAKEYRESLALSAL